MLSRFVEFFARRSRMTLVLWIVVFAFGAVSYLGLLPREGFPSVDIPISIGNGVWFVEDDEQVDALIAPLTEDLLTQPGVTSVTTVARDNVFTVVAEFDEGIPSADGAALVEARAEALGFPPEVDFSASAVNASKFFEEFDLLVGVYSENATDAATLEATAQSIIGSFDHADIDRAEVIELTDRGIDPATGQEVSRVERFNQLAVGERGDLRLVPSVAIGVVAADGVDSIGIRDATDDVLADVTAAGTLPDGFDTKVAIDQATQIRQQVSSLESNVLTGVIAVALIALVLISWRASIITALFLVTVIAVTMAVFWVVGITLSTISLIGVILALGLFVDDSIVITEALDAFRDDGDGPVEIIGNAIRRVGSASVSGTVTTLLVFAPMLAISGVLGSFIRVLPISVIIALTSSLILSLIVIPMAARYLILPAPRSAGPVARVQDRVADVVASLPGRGGKAGIAIGLAGFAFSIMMTVVGLFVFAPRVGFNIFPPQKDSNFVAAAITFEPGTTVEQARTITTNVNQQVLDALGDDLEDIYQYFGNTRGAEVQFELVKMGDRAVAPDIVDDILQPIGDRTDGASVVFSQLSAGPPEALFPFQLQLFGTDDAALLAGAETIAAELNGAKIERPNGTTFTVVETDIALTDTITRLDGRRYVEVLARFDGDDVTTTTAETENFVKEQFDETALAALGLPADALGFDFGQESENQESFASMPRAFLIALGLMMLLLIVQFRSSIQWLLVFLAIPFSFFGVFGGLLITDNQISFFVMLGLLGLIGIAVNNTILLTDFANQEREGGATRQEAIRNAMRNRFRPLVATTLTTVAGVLPLALSDPFWEALGFTIIFGLLSSTVLVIVSFPYYYLAFEWLRDKVRTPWRRGSGRRGSGRRGSSKTEVAALSTSA